MIFSFLSSVLGGVIVCPSVVFPVVVVLSVLRFTAFNYPFGGIFKLFILYMQYFIWSHLHIDAFKPFTFLLLNYFEMFPNQQGVVIILRKFSQLPGKNDDITQTVMFFCNDQFILVNFVLNCQDCSSDWYKFSELVFKKKKNLNWTTFNKSFQISTWCTLIVQHAIKSSFDSIVLLNNLNLFVMLFF